MADAQAKSRRWAIAAFLALVTSVLMPWWGVTWDDGQIPIRESVSLFRAEAPLTTSWGPTLAGVLVAAAVALLFVRIAARSDIHEPVSWRRDLRIALGLAAAAVASALFWPSGVPSFWGGRTYADANATGPAIVETAAPMLGWWVAILAGLCLAVAFKLAHPTTPK
jgi:hypothetical protein